MRILIIHNRYKTSNMGGEDIVYQNELDSLKQTLGDDRVFFYEVCNDNINKLSLVFNIFFNKEHYIKVADMIKKHNIDLVHIHNFFPLLSISVLKACVDSKVKVVHTLHSYRLWCISGIFYTNKNICERCAKSKFAFFGVLNKCFRNSYSQSLLASLAFAYYKINGIFDLIDYFFVLSDFSKQKLLELGVNSNKLILKPNSLNIAPPKIKQKKDYIYVGRLEEQKGIYVLLDVWSKLDESFVLRVVGTSDEAEYIQQKYRKKNIIFEGKCSRQTSIELIAKSKYLIQPSLMYETFGLSMLEAFGCGVGVIGFDIGTRSELIQDEVNGFLCKKQELKDTIIKSYNFKDYEKISNNAIKTFNKYSNDVIIKEQINIYKKIIKEQI